jgi:chromosome partitioning protein
MAQIICIANQKGGVGKTTTSINLAAALAQIGKTTLLVDCDPQANTTTGIGIDKSTLKQHLYHGLIGDVDIKELIHTTAVAGLSVIPARVELIGFEVEMMAHEGRELVMRELLDEVKDAYDYIVIDCPPSLSLLTLNAMASADSILVPLQSEFYALEGLTQLIDTVKRIKASLNPRLRISGILLTMFDRRTNLSFQVAEEAEKHFNDLVFSTRIPRSVRLSEAPSYGEPIFQYAPSSVGATSYLALAHEVVER